MRTGFATVPLDYGTCPPWLFERMKKLSRAIASVIIEEFGVEEFLKRISDPVWFQSFGCVSGFDWNSSGLGTTTMGALKEGLRGLEKELGIFICGGKGKTSRKTPEQIQEWGEFLKKSPEEIDKLIYASKTSAKVDNNALQDGFQIYHHNLIFIKTGQWAVLQQGMNENISQARRYHWLSLKLKDFIEEPHSGIVSDKKVKPLNLTAKESGSNREVSLKQVVEEPDKFIKNLSLVQRRPNQPTLLKVYNKEFYWHPVAEEKFDLKRLKKTIFFAKEQDPKNFEQLLTLKGVGPRTIRALSLVSEIIYGAKPSYEDPARYTFSVGGKDGTPFPVDRKTYDQTLEIMEKGIKKSKVSIKEKESAFKRLIGIQ
ncbi:MAG: DUF763 domain-containing protein [Candidatus Nealsonbacteria bacterium]